MKLPNNFFATLRSVLFAIILSLGLGYAYAWTGPTAPAPGNNTPAPINEGAFNQLKNAGLSLNTLAVFGNALVGKLQLSDVSIEGAACSPNGTLSRNTTGETLACVSGIWTKASGGSGGGSTFIAANITIPTTGTYDFNSYLPAGVTPTAIQVTGEVGDNNATVCCSASASLTVDGKYVVGFSHYTNNTGSGPNGPVVYNTFASLLVTPGTHTVVWSASRGDRAPDLKITGYFVGGGSSSGGGKAVGEIFSFAGVTCPTGSLLANGSTFSAATYPALNTLLGGNTLPDLRGEFVRGLDNGRGVDTARTLLSAQLDQFQGHWHESAHSNGGSGNAPTGNTDSFIAGPVRDPIADGSGNGTPRFGSETRPRNVAMNMCIAAQ